MIRIAAQSQRLITEFLEHNETISKQLHLELATVGEAFLELTNRIMAHPDKMMEQQMSLWQGYMQLWQNATLRMLGEKVPPVVEPEQGDKRFKAPEWTDNQIFDFIKQSYLLTARWTRNLVAATTEDLDDEDAEKLDFQIRQFIDAMSPSNFALTNPEVIRTTLETGGENLVRGLENLLRDLERGKGQLAITQTDLDAFEVGVNVGASPGKVVFQNELIQLIQYAPSTKTVYKTPLLIIPPWINKFYILDLKPKNSLVKWLVSKGYTVFMVSWRNPDESMADTGFEDYMTKGALAALDVVEDITGEKAPNLVGYCIGGTLLATTLAHLAAKGQDQRVRSATFFVAQVDFEDAGELKLFTDDEELEYIRAILQERGYLDGRELATTFNMLRANDLIWSFVVNNYLLGKEPFPSDLLYWNSDSTRLPRAMCEFYLKEMYQENNLVKPGKLTLAGTPIDLTKITAPTYILAAQTDHICPPQSVYKATRTFSGRNRFVLTGSGHIAGVVNPPAAKKYNHWTNDPADAAPPATLDEWIRGAVEHAGSWWPDWHNWLKGKSGRRVPARAPGSDKYKPIEDAPGSYVKQRYS
ncbi:MAG: class I poly(R)-hydroxyalkanoic acid synthase [Alphaproteobacteria bacterium]|nr:MAG: class I poly(R)-hydroxyalkanoic acid synthase [Alphaproteobacteria bacterium]